MPEVKARDGVSLHWEERGSGPAVLLTPYWAMHPSIFDPIEADLSKRLSSRPLRRARDRPVRPGRPVRHGNRGLGPRNGLRDSGPVRGRRSASSTRRTARCASPTHGTGSVALVFCIGSAPVQRRRAPGLGLAALVGDGGHAPISSSSRPTTAARVRAALRGERQPHRGRGAGPRPDPDGVHRGRGAAVVAREHGPTRRRRRGARTARSEAASASASRDDGRTGRLVPRRAHEMEPVVREMFPGGSGFTGRTTGSSRRRTRSRRPEGVARGRG